MIRLGLIGAGNNGCHNITQLTRDPGRCRLTAVADPMPEAAARVARDFGAAHAVGDFHDFLDQVDAVVISSPNRLHPEQAIACAQAGKHVWIEKPMAMSTADADAICAACDAAGVHSFVGFSVRFDPIPRTLAAEYTSGRLGPLRSIWSRRLCNLFQGGKQGWRSSYENSGGVMAELLAHEIDWMIDVAGDPCSVYCRIATSTPDHPKANDHVWLTLGFADGSTGTIEGSQDTPVADYHKGIVGARASATDRNWGGDAFYSGPEGDRQLEPLPAFDKHEHFLDVLEGNAESLADCHHGRKVVLLSEQALESAVRGTVIDLVPSPAAAKR